MVPKLNPDVKPAVGDGVVRLFEGELQLVHVWAVQTNKTSLAGQRHQHQTRLLSGRHHVTVLCDHHPVSANQNKQEPWISLICTIWHPLD